jgi:hypothetical protein
MPCVSSIAVGVLVPRPRMNLSGVFLASVCEAMASTAGVREKTFTMPVPRLSRRVDPAILASWTNASPPHSSPTYTRSNPRFSAVRAVSVAVDDAESSAIAALMERLSGATVKKVVTAPLRR